MATCRYEELEGKVVLVTGASRGIGRAIAVAFADQGATVIVNSRTLEGAGPTVEEIAGRGGVAEAAVGDVGDPTLGRRVVNDVIARHDRLDVLVNNAAIGPIGPLLDLSQETWEEVQRTNLWGLFHCGQAAARNMMENGGGSILVIGSPGADEAYSAQVPYCTAKAGLQMLAKGMAWEWGSSGIRTNVIQPGWVETELNSDYLANGETRDRLLVQIPQRRFGAPEEVAAAAVWLCSDGASYVNGATLSVDGGYASGRPTILPKRLELLQR